MSRFRYIQQDGTEGHAETVTELVSAYASQRLAPETMLYDAVSGRWAPAAEHDVIATLRSADRRPGASGSTTAVEDRPPVADTPTVTAAPLHTELSPTGGAAAIPVVPPAQEATHPSGRRVLARIVDVVATPFLALFLVAFLVSLLGASGDGSTIYWGLIAAVLMIPTEALCVATIGATPGKLLTGLRVVDAATGRRPRFSQALYRSWLVWFRGFGLGIPLVFLICWLVAHHNFTKYGRPTWDGDANTMVVRRGASGEGWGAGAGLGMVGCLAFAAFGLLQIWAGAIGIAHTFGRGWAGAALVAALGFRFTPPIVLGAFLAAKNVWGWHWFFALLFALPGLAFMLPSVIGAMLPNRDR